MMRLVYLILLLGSFLSCAGGPVNVLRWISIPFHWLIGAMFHLFALFLLWRAAYSDNAKLCSVKYPDDDTFDYSGAAEPEPTEDGAEGEAAPEPVPGPVDPENATGDLTELGT